MKTAIISVSDKFFLQRIAYFLLDIDFQILSSGGTYTKLKALLKQHQDKLERIRKVEDLTEFPEILGGRVKTLHPKIHGGILAETTKTTHQNDLEKHHIPNISVVVVNLYPFEKVITDESLSYDERVDEDIAIENIDIGGHTLIRAAAKNYKDVLVLTNPNQYENIIFNYTFENNEEMLKIRRQYALDAWKHITHYDATITNYFYDGDIIYRRYHKKQPLKYGCNPTQEESFIFSVNNNKIPFEILNGKLGYINTLDAINSWQLVYELGNRLAMATAASFKHTSPAGVGVSNNNLSSVLRDAYCLDKNQNYNNVSIAYLKARNSDPMSSFGDFIAIYGKVEKETALLIKREISDGIIALDYSQEALEILKKKKRGKYIILKGVPVKNPERVEYREMYGLCISQEVNTAETDTRCFLSNIKTKNKKMTQNGIINLTIANTSLKYSQSNSVAYAYEGQLVGLGAGQQSRVDCVKLAGRKTDIWFLRQHPKVLDLFHKFVDGIKRQAKINAAIRYIEGDFTKIEKEHWESLFTEKIEPLTNEEKSKYLSQLSNVALASDAFFPFRDNIDHCSKRGVKYIIQPGGSIADTKIIDACNEYDMVMMFTGVRLFTH